MKSTATVELAPLLGDHLAMDLLNTEARNDGAVVDYWQSGDDVLAWLARQGVAEVHPQSGRPASGQASSQADQQANPPVDIEALRVRAVALRALARRLIAGKKHRAHAEAAGAYIDTDVDTDVDTDTNNDNDTGADLAILNDYLHAHLTAPHLAPSPDGKLALTRTARGDAVASLLGPVAEAVAQLLVDGDFALVRQCEHPDCILWFYDRTKSHKRRWCSMALCGNRYKAAQFRKKNSQ